LFLCFFVKIFLSELSDNFVGVILLLHYRLKLFSYVKDMIWIYECPSIFLALAINILTTNKLLIEHNHYFKFCLSNNSSS